MAAAAIDMQIVCILKMTVLGKEAQVKNDGEAVNETDGGFEHRWRKEVSSDGEVDCTLELHLWVAGAKLTDHCCRVSIIDGTRTIEGLCWSMAASGYCIKGHKGGKGGR